MLIRVRQCRRVVMPVGVSPGGGEAPVKVFTICSFSISCQSLLDTPSFRLAQDVSLVIIENRFLPATTGRQEEVLAALQVPMRNISTINE
jgi:hypothetical protein